MLPPSTTRSDGFSMRESLVSLIPRVADGGKTRLDLPSNVHVLFSSNKPPALWPVQFHPRIAHPAIRPPSTRTSDPVVKEEAADKSHTTVSATSRGWPRRPTGICACSLARALF